MQADTNEVRSEAVKKILASWAIEGFRPDRSYMILVGHYVEREFITARMLEAIVSEYSRIGIGVELV